MQKTKRILAVCLSALLILTALPFTALPALGAEIVASGECGDNLTWTLDDAGTLTISGTGEMWDFLGEVPWDSYRSQISTVVIEVGVTSIGSYAFSGCRGLTSITIPDSVTSIGEYAFHGCAGLSSITIPDSVTSIGSYAFAYCAELITVTIPESVTSIEEYAFSGCTGLTGVYITDLASWCGINFHYDCDWMNPFASNPLYYAHNLYINGALATSIAIPDNVTSIGAEAFCGCTGLTEITIPDSVTSIGEYAFSGCTGVTKLVLNANVSYSFSDFSNLREVEIGSNVTSIGYGAFSGCTGLSEITIPDSVTSIGSYAFYNCSGLTSVTIPDSVTFIGEAAFYGCRGLTSVSIPDSVTIIGGDAFEGCTGLTSVTIPDSVTSIGDAAFLGCTGLTSVTIPDSVTSIGSSAFSGCTGLSEITLPKSVTNIYGGTFSGCSVLTDVYYGGTEVDWNNIYFGSNNEYLRNATIHFHEHAYEITESVDYTCTEAGHITYACACGDTYTEVLPAAHRFTGTPVPATCTMMGYTDYVCTECGESYTDYVSATGHLDKNADGVCDSCGFVLSGGGTPTPHTEHTYGEWTLVSEPTCTADGTEIRVCALCSAFEKRAVAAPGHKDENADGVCDVCLAVLALPENPAAEPHTEHTYGEWTVVSAPTCVSPGYEIRICTGCSKYEVRENAALGHLDGNNDGLCDRCRTALLIPEIPSGGSEAGNASVSGIQALFSSIVSFFRSIADIFRNIFR